MGPADPAAESGDSSARQVPEGGEGPEVGSAAPGGAEGLPGQPAGPVGVGGEPSCPGDEAIHDPGQEPELDEETAREVEMMMADLAGESLDAVYGAVPTASPQAKDGVQKCRVVMLSGDDVFVDLGTKSQGVVPRQQFGQEVPEVGDYVELVLDYYDADSGLMVMSREGALREATWATLEKGSLVEGRVTGMNKGGLEVDLKGIRAFMPASQVDLARLHDISTLIGQRVRCIVTEVDRKDQNVLLSRRKYLEKEQAEAREQTLRALHEGDLVTGKVVRLTDFGAFVDLGGVDGLLHIKDLSYGRVEKVRDVVKVGQTVEVKVLRVDTKKERISLGLKQVKPDPWTDVEQKYASGMRVKVRVSQLAEFGAFAELEDGVEGLIPLSEMSRIKRVRRPGEVVNPGEVVEVSVLKVDGRERRISLSIKELEEDPWAGAVEHFPANDKAKGKVTRLTDFGAFVELRPGVEGLIHISELSENRVRTAAEVVSLGQEVEVRVLGVDPDRRRISLSMKPAPEEMVGPATAGEHPPQPRKRKKPLRGGLSWEGIGDMGDLRGLGGFGS